MHIVVIGAGGVGGYYGGKISNSGQKVSFLVRGAHLDAIRQHGLRIKSLDKEFVTQPFLATDNIREIEKADLVLVCTKSWQVKEAAKTLLPVLKEDTVVIPLQNGADNEEKLLSVLDKHYVLGGLCNIYSKIEAPGVIHHFGHIPDVIFGELDQTKTDRLLEVKKIFDKAGIKAIVSKNIYIDIWNKFMFINTVSGLGGLTRASIGNMYKHPELHKMLEKTALETYAVGKAKGIILPEDMVKNVMHFISKQPYDATASTQRDLMEGRPSELDNFNGYVVREGEKLGIPTPVNSFIYNCLQPMEEKARKAS